MKLTPLGKALLFLVGLALVVTAVYKFVPREKLPWNRPKAADASEPAATATESRSSEASPSATTASTQPWIEVPGGLFASGQNQESVDVPAFKIRRTETTNGEYEAFLAECAAGSSCGPRELPS